MDVRLNRRTFLIGAGATAVVAACGGSNTPEEFFASRFAAPFTIVADGTEQRIPIGLADEVDPLQAEDMPERIVAAISQEGSLVAPRQDVFLRSEGIVFPYYPIRASFDEPGIYEVEVSWNAGVANTLIQVNATDESPLLMPGEEMPPVITPTFDEPQLVNPICTLPEPCAYHDITLAEALQQGRPIVLVVSTPGFCATFICGPLLELAIADNESRPDAYKLLHAEVYKEPALLPDSEPTNIMFGTGMAEAGFEPSVFFVGADGRVKERIDNVCDGTELREAIDRLIA